MRNQFTTFFDQILRSQLILKGIIREEQWDDINSEIQYKWAEDSYYRETKNSEMLMEKIKNIYKEYTRIPKKELDKILKHDIWWEAEKCLEYGLVDEII